MPSTIVMLDHPASANAQRRSLWPWVYDATDSSLSWFEMESGRGLANGEKLGMIATALKLQKVVRERFHP